MKNKYKNMNKVKIIPPLIRDEFKSLKKKKYKKSGIIVAIGGSDPQKLIFKLIKKLRRHKLKIYTTTANKDLRRLKMIKDIELHINDELSAGFATSRFAIITPSTITYEAIYMKIPFLAIQTAKNQDTLVQYLKKNHYMVLKKGELWKINLKKFSQKL